MHQCNRCLRDTIPESSIAVICFECKDKEKKTNKEWMNKKDKEKMGNDVRDLFGFFKRTK